MRQPMRNKRITELQKQIAEAKASIFKPIIGCEMLLVLATEGIASWPRKTTVAAGIDRSGQK